MARFISRDPFAREELWRENAGKGCCSWCGTDRKLYSYYIEPDSIAPRASRIKGSFCSVGCMRAYHF